MKKLSEEYIRNHFDEIDWHQLNQQLSQSFIREFKDQINWGWVSWRNNLSKDFIRQMIDYIYEECLQRNMYKQIRKEFYFKNKGE